MKPIPRSNWEGNKYNKNTLYEIFKELVKYFGKPGVKCIQKSKAQEPENKKTALKDLLILSLALKSGVKEPVEELSFN